MSIGQTVFQWIDVLWIPAAVLAVHKDQRIKAVFFVVCCMIMMRLQVELMDELGLTTGLLPLMTAPLYTRGLITYAIFIFLFLLLSYYSARVNPFVYIAASLTVFGIAFCASSLVMLL